jgi:hypothetical protein
MTTRCLVFSGLVLLGGANLEAQSPTPISAKMRLTTEVSVNGNVEKTHTQEGDFYIASNGSELQQWTTRDGKETTGEMRWAGLTDAVHNTGYKVDYQNRLAYEQPFARNASPAPSSKAPASQNLSQDSVEGYPCVRYPARLILPGKPPTVVGYSCRSESYDGLELKRETTTIDSSGRTVHSTFELYDIRPGVEPDARLFDLSNFTVYKPTPKN